MINLTSFVQQNAPYMTLTDLVEESGSKFHHIKQILDKLGIKPISQKQKIRNYILDHYKTKSKAWIAERCDMGLVNLDNYYIEMKIVEPSELANPPEKISVRRIFESYKIPEAGHYMEPIAIELAMKDKTILPEPEKKSESFIDMISDKARELPPDWKPDHPITMDYLQQFSEEASKIFKP